MGGDTILMSVNRRDFAKLFSAGAVSITALKEVKGVPTEIHATEIKKGKQYLLVIEDRIPAEICKEMQEWLNACGMNVLVIAEPNMKLFEIERSQK